MEHITPVARAAKIVGGLSKLASMVGVSAPTMYEWKTSARPVPIARCLSIEQATKGEVTRRDLRPNDWQHIWPELATGGQFAQAVHTIHAE